MRTIEELRERQTFLQQSHDTGNPQMIAAADAQRTIWHDEQMAYLADDAYDSAMHTGTPPPGWIRVSKLLDGHHKELRERPMPQHPIPQHSMPQHSMPQHPMHMQTMMRTTRWVVLALLLTLTGCLGAAPNPATQSQHGVYRVYTDPRAQALAVAA